MGGGVGGAGGEIKEGVAKVEGAMKARPGIGWGVFGGVGVVLGLLFGVVYGRRCGRETVRGGHHGSYELDDLAELEESLAPTDELEREGEEESDEEAAAFTIGQPGGGGAPAGLLSGPVDGEI